MCQRFSPKPDLESTEFDGALGTLGGGNHFAELQMVNEVLDARAFKRFGLGKQQLVVLVHSGSRGLGESVLRGYVEEHQAGGSDAESFAAAAYLQGHDLAVRWAKVNRGLLAQRFVQQLGAEADLLWDGCHNSITAREHEGETVWVHRKGAVAAESEAVVIPGSRGSLSYLVKPLGDGESHAWSLAHGAGRKWARSEARQRMRERFGMHQLAQTPLGGRVICGERDLLYEEAPAAYKNIEDCDSGPRGCRTRFGHRDVPTAPHLQDACVQALTRPARHGGRSDWSVKASLANSYPAHHSLSADFVRECKAARAAGFSTRP